MEFNMETFNKMKIKLFFLFSITFLTYFETQAQINAVGSFYGSGMSYYGGICDGRIEIEITNTSQDSIVLYNGYWLAGLIKESSIRFRTSSLANRLFITTFIKDSLDYHAGGDFSIGQDGLLLSSKSFVLIKPNEKINFNFFIAHPNACFDKLQILLWLYYANYNDFKSVVQPLSDSCPKLENRIDYAIGKYSFFSKQNLTELYPIQGLSKDCIYDFQSTTLHESFLGKRIWLFLERKNK